ncbi:MULTISPECIES: GIN domain-containing protein [unclassified Sphingomonas]|uniref:GIN domain-containing protein n=1 Tax=unclassified Sphingomonas TaxID=196159 RepID=UPI000ABCE82B|nr:MULTISPECIES: DUF2807 domain-containing protein [unclassified Sphingomonas]
MHRWMVLAMLGLTACGGDSAVPDAATDEQLAILRDFDTVALDSRDSVEVRRGEGFAVRVEGPAERRAGLILRRDGHILRISRSEGGLWAVDRDAARIVVTMPVIAAATLSGSGDITIDQAGDPFTGTLGGSGDMTIGQLQGGRTTLTVAGTGTIAAAGSVRSLTLTIVGSGDIDVRQVQAADAAVSITGSGDIKAAIDGPARVSLTGSGSAMLGRGARCTVNRVGTGEAHCG